MSGQKPRSPAPGEPRRLPPRYDPLMVLDNSGLRDLINDLDEHWAEASLQREMYQPAARKGKKFIREDMVRISLVMGLSRHSYETAKSVLVLLDHGMTAQAVPLVRLTYECALVVSHVVQSEEQHGVRAFLHEYNRLGAAAKQDAEKSVSEVFRNGAASFVDVDPSKFEGSFDTVRNFQDVCADLQPGGKDAFLIYRMLCKYSHPSLPIADSYFQKIDHPNGLPGVRDIPEISLSEDVLLQLLASSLVWSGRAFSYLTRNKADRSFLRAKARALGVTDGLQLSEVYWKRHSRQAQKMQRESNSVQV